MKNRPWAGATKNFPDGMLNADDEGELKVAIGVEDGNIVIHFGKPVAWLGLDSKSARWMAASLLSKANALDERGDDLDG